MGREPARTPRSTCTGRAPAAVARPGRGRSRARGVTFVDAADAAAVVHLPPNPTSTVPLAKSAARHPGVVVDLGPGAASSPQPGLGAADAVLVDSAWDAGQLAARHPTAAGKISVAPAPIDLDRFAPQAQLLHAHGSLLKRFRRYHRLGEPCLLFVGPYTPNGGLDIAIEAAYLLRERFADVRLAAIPSGPVDSAFLDLCERRVLGLGHRGIVEWRVEEAELPFWYATASVVCALAGLGRAPAPMPAASRRRRGAAVRRHRRRPAPCRAGTWVGLGDPGPDRRRAGAGRRVCAALRGSRSGGRAGRRRSGTGRAELLSACRGAASRLRLAGCRGRLGSSPRRVAADPANASLPSATEVVPAAPEVLLRLLPPGPVPAAPEQAGQDAHRRAEHRCRRVRRDTLDRRQDTNEAHQGNPSRGGWCRSSRHARMERMAKASLTDGRRRAISSLSRETMNPYLSQLYAALEDEGVPRGADASLDLRWLLGHRTEVRWLHAHWPAGLYRWHRGPARLRPLCPGSSSCSSPFASAWRDCSAIASFGRFIS